MRRPPAPTAWTSTATTAASPSERHAGCSAPAGPPACCPGCTRAARLATALPGSRRNSAAHLLYGADDEDVGALARAGVVAVVCPSTAIETGRPPPVRALLDKGVAMALGSDHTPGGNGITSMPLVIALAVSYFGLSVTEALRAATIGGAHALRAPDRGAMARGRFADIVAWDADHEGAFAWAYGLKPLRVWLGGEPVTG